MMDKESVKHSYEINPRPIELGGGWRLRLLEDGKEVGGGVFPVEQNEVSGIVWWNGLNDAERAEWLKRADLPTAADAYLAYLKDEAYTDAESEAYSWLDSHSE